MKNIKFKFNLLISIDKDIHKVVDKYKDIMEFHIFKDFLISKVQGNEILK